MYMYRVNPRKKRREVVVINSYHIIHILYLVRIKI